MSLEKKAEALLEAATNLINAVTGMVTELKGSPVSGKVETAAAPPDTDKTKAETKKELGEIKALAKTKAGSVLSALGKDKLAELLKAFGAKKFTDIKGDVPAFQEFIDAADKMIADKKEDDDLLGMGDPAPDKKEYTLEDVKATLLKINNAEGLGRDVTKQILADLGVARLGELKADRFNDVMEKAEKALTDAMGK